MLNFRVLSIVSLAFFCACVHAQTPATNPAPSKLVVGDGEARAWMPIGPVWDPWWMPQHQQFVDHAKKDADVLIIGDQDAAGWAQYESIWTKYFGTARGEFLGIRSDPVQHLLWRIENGELDGMNPKIVVVMIGAQNCAQDDSSRMINVSGEVVGEVKRADTPDEIALGISTVLKEIRQKLPVARVLIVGILPTGNPATNGQDRSTRARMRAVNALIAEFADQKMVFYVDMSDKFLNETGGVFPSLRQSRLAGPTPAGYEVLAQVMRPIVDGAMKRSK